jgi:hypothetical protein
MNTQMPASGGTGKSTNWLAIGLGVVVVCLCLVVVGGGVYFFLLRDQGTPAVPVAPPPTSAPEDTPLPPPTSPPADTPTPIPTETSTPTVMPTQSLTSITEAMIGLVDNVGVPEAAAYDKTQPGPHRMLLLTQEGELYENYFAFFPESWKPSYVSETELVAMITFQQAVQSTQRYRDNQGNLYVMRRIREDFYIRLKEAKTGRIVSERLFQGQDPKHFEQRKYIDEDYYGNPPKVEDIQEWLEEFVKP